MKLNSISGVVFEVEDLDKTKNFYESLGFRFGSPKGNYLTAYINWFWIEFHPKKSKQNTISGSGQSLYIKVDKVDELYKLVSEKGLRAKGGLQETEFGRREFNLSDPDGYKLVFFEKK